MLEIGTQAPDFSLPDPVSGHKVSRSDYAGKPLLVVFSCNHCPYVLHIIESFTGFANTVQQRGVGVVMISANDASAYPQDGPQKMAEFARQKGFEFPYLYLGSNFKSKRRERNKIALNRSGGVQQKPDHSPRHSLPRDRSSHHHIQG